MKKRTLFLGVVLLCLGLFQLVNYFMPTSIIPYFVNYQVLLVIVGIYLLLKKGVDNLTGYIIIFLGVYLYIDDFFKEYYTDIILPILLMIAGIMFIAHNFINVKNEKEKINKDNDNLGNN